MEEEKLDYLFTKIDELYDNPKSKKFVLHLIQSYFPLGKSDFLLDKPKGRCICAITKKPLISKGEVISIIMSKEYNSAFIENIKEQFKFDKEGKTTKPPIRKFIGDKTLAVKGEKTSTYLSVDAYDALFNWISSKILNGDKTINYIMKKMRGAEITKVLDEHPNLQDSKSKNKVEKIKPIIRAEKKATFGDLGILQEIKEKMLKDE